MMTSSQMCGAEQGALTPLKAAAGKELSCLLRSCHMTQNSKHIQAKVMLRMLLGKHCFAGMPDASSGTTRSSQAVVTARSAAAVPVFLAAACGPKSAAEALSLCNDHWHHLLVMQCSHNRKHLWLICSPVRCCQLHKSQQQLLCPEQAPSAAEHFVIVIMDLLAAELA